MVQGGATACSAAHAAPMTQPVSWTPGARALMHTQVEQPTGSAGRAAGGLGRAARCAPVSTAFEGPLKSKKKLSRLANMDSVQPVCSYPVIALMSLSHCACSSEPQQPTYTPTCARAAGDRSASATASGRRAAGWPHSDRAPARRAPLGSGLHGKGALCCVACAGAAPARAGRGGRARSLPRSARWFMPESAQASYATSSSLRSCGSILCARRAARERQAAQAVLAQPVRRSRPHSPLLHALEKESSIVLHSALHAGGAPASAEQRAAGGRRAACCTPLRGRGAPAPASRAPRRRRRRSGRTRPACRSAPACCAGRPASGGRPA